MLSKCLTDANALKILKSDNVYLKTSVQFDYALINAIQALEEKVIAEQGLQDVSDDLHMAIKRLDNIINRG